MNALNLKQFVTHVFPKSIVESMANNEILQILVFVLFFDVALGKLHDSTARSLLKTTQEFGHVMFQWSQTSAGKTGLPRPCRESCLKRISVRFRANPGNVLGAKADHALDIALHEHGVAAPGQLPVRVGAHHRLLAPHRQVGQSAGFAATWIDIGR